MAIAFNGKICKMVALKRDLVKPESSKNYLYFQALEDNATIGFSAPTGSTTVDYEISIDGNSWSDWNSTTIGSVRVFDTITLKTFGDYVMVRAKNETNSWTSNSSTGLRFDISQGKVKAGGSVMSLKYKDPTDKTSVISQTYIFNNLFNGCECLVYPPELPATTLSSDCYHNMFFGCISLLIAPALPATTLASSCYYGMFHGCTS